jgi:hypothetical protein
LLLLLFSLVSSGLYVGVGAWVASCVCGIAAGIGAGILSTKGRIEAGCGWQTGWRNWRGLLCGVVVQNGEKKRRKKEKAEGGNGDDDPRARLVDLGPGAVAKRRWLHDRKPELS